MFVCRGNLIILMVIFSVFFPQLQAAMKDADVSLSAMALFEASLAAKRSGNLDEAHDSAVKSLRLCKNAKSRAETRLYLAQLCADQKEFYLARAHYEMLKNEGQNWIAAALFGIAETSLFLGEHERFNRCRQELFDKFPDHPLLDHLNRIGKNLKNSGKSSSSTQGVGANSDSSDPDRKDNYVSEADFEKQSDNFAVVEGEREKSVGHASMAVWRATPQGKVESRGLEYDFDNDQDFPAQNLAVVRYEHDLGSGFALVPEFWQLEADACLNNSLTFDGLTYGSGSMSHLKIQMHEIVLAKDLRFNEGYRLNASIGAAFPEMLLRLRQYMASGIREGKITQKKTLPVLGLNFCAPGRRVRPFIDAKIMNGGFNGEAFLQDYLVGLRMVSGAIFSNQAKLEAELGYRWWQMRSVSGADNLFRLKLHGLFFGLNLLF